MQVLQNDYTTLPAGAIVELKGKSLAMVRHVRDFVPAEDAPDRADGTPARGYSHFTVGGRSFTIDDQSPDDIMMLKDKNARKGIASLMLEASEYQKPVLDENKNVIPDESETVKSFRFVAIITAEDAKAYAKTEGEVAQEEAKWAPKAPVQQAVTDERLGKLIGAQLSSLLPGIIQAAMPAPVVAQAAPAALEPVGP